MVGRQAPPPPASSPVWSAELVERWSDGGQLKASGPFLPLYLKKPAEERQNKRRETWYFVTDHFYITETKLAVEV